MKMEQTECSETSAYKIQMPGNHPNESIQHSGHGKSLKSRNQEFRSQLCYAVHGVGEILSCYTYRLKTKYKVT